MFSSNVWIIYIFLSRFHDQKATPLQIFMLENMQKSCKNSVMSNGISFSLHFVWFVYTFVYVHTYICYFYWIVYELEIMFLLSKVLYYVFTENKDNNLHSQV